MTGHVFVVRLQLYLLVIFLMPIFACADNEFLTPVTSSREIIKKLLEHNTTNKHSISICYNYGCKSKRRIIIHQDNIQSIKAVFGQSDTGRYGERLAIARAIALLEKVAATQSPVYNDKAENYNDNGLPGRMDCIDSTVNTTHYLEFINNLGLLHQYTLQSPVYRSPYLMGQHWAAQIQDQSDGQRYAVDSWQTDIGQAPIIQDVESWTGRVTPERF